MRYKKSRCAAKFGLKATSSVGGQSDFCEFFTIAFNNAQVLFCYKYQLMYWVFKSFGQLMGIQHLKQNAQNRNIFYEILPVQELNIVG